MNKDRLYKLVVVYSCQRVKKKLGGVDLAGTVSVGAQDFE